MPKNRVSSTRYAEQLATIHAAYQSPVSQTINIFPPYHHVFVILTVIGLVVLASRTPPISPYRT